MLTEPPRLIRRGAIDHVDSPLDGASGLLSGWSRHQVKRPEL